MEKMDLVSYYKSKAKEWMFTPSIQTVAIDDDEILDLDSISLDSNEDTWLYSSSTSTVDSSSNRNIDMDDVVKEKKSYAFQENDKSSICDSNISLDSSLFSPGLIKSADDCHESFLNSFDHMSESQYDLLCRTPINTSKTKSNMLRKAFSTPRQMSNPSEKSFNSAPKTEINDLQNDGLYPSLEEDTFVFKKPTSRRDSSDKSSILHSVENKLFTITDAEITDLKSIQNREIRSADGVRKTIDAIKPEKHFSEINDSEKTDEKKDSSGKVLLVTPTMNQKVNQSDFDCFRMSEVKALENNENIFKKSLPVWHSTPQTNQNGNRVSSKKSLLLQPSPVLLNRYLKYNKVEDKSVNRADWHGSSEFPREEINNKHDKNEMNVSYIKYSRDSVDSSSGLHCSSDDDLHIKSNLNTTFSKSDDVLSSPSKSHHADFNSADELAIEDDVLSSTSESSLSSMGNKHPLSIMEVRKMAERQEMSLKQHMHSSCYTGSSKSSEVSSSSESISAFGALSSSNETNVNHSRSANLQKTVTKRFNSGTYNRGGLRLNLQKKTEVSSAIKKPTIPADETKPNAIFRSRMTPVNGIGLRNEQIQQLPVKKQLPQRPPSLTRQPAPQVKVDEEFVSVKEIKSRDNTEVKTMNAVKSTENSGPVSHIPRPSSRIPMLRTSASCTRYNKNK